MADTLKYKIVILKHQERLCIQEGRAVYKECQKHLKQKL